jgi:hypothetical protein
MKKRALVLVGGAVSVVALVAAILVFSLEPATVTHAQTPVIPIGLPPTGAGGMSEGFGLAIWAVLAVVGALVLGVGGFILARRAR